MKNDFASQNITGGSRQGPLVWPADTKNDADQQIVKVTYRKSIDGRLSDLKRDQAWPTEIGKTTDMTTGEIGQSGEGASSCARMCAHLPRHQVNADFKTLLFSALGVGDLILNAASEEGSDLLVLGAYDPLSRGAHTAG